VTETTSFDAASLTDQKGAGTQIARAFVGSDYFGIAGETDFRRWMSARAFSESGSVPIGLAMAADVNYTSVIRGESVKRPMNAKWLKTGAPFLLLALTLLALLAAIKVLPPDTAHELIRYVTYFKY
jgi:hypothetical protein